ncbi:YncE family protein [Nocardioides pocheonensis]|uniref:YncE family protein n=1 Tax=Nocardioides pocheonensis TaxID=661485 RepID=A0A3N0GMY9_9ACTN|nr:YncE family protein [Nocardioides pocheonensis]RNM13835.1 YncE family protein [Nocardioides pocheonensis]
MTRSARRGVGAACVSALALATVALAGCSSGPPAARSATPPSSAPSPGSTSAAHPAAEVPKGPFAHPLPGMPPVVGQDVYGADRPGELSPAVAGDRPMIYVPDSSPTGHTVTLIDPTTYKVVGQIEVGDLSQHVTPSYDLTRLYTNSSVSNELVQLDPRTARRVRSISVPRPYNLYFTPDGKQAVVMVEQHDIIQFSRPKSFKPIKEVTAPGCSGPNHADFSANGRFMVVTCEFSGELVKVATLSHKVLGVLKFGSMSMPQDVRLSPDGRTFYVADMGTDQLRRVSAASFKQVGVLAMPSHPHGLYPSRDSRFLYVSDRGAGRVSVVSFRTHKIVDTWVIPGGGSPDMGGVSADGKTLWLAGRYDHEVYAFDTATGKLRARIQVPGSPHGLCVWPQPGRYSLGHTGNLR